MKSKNLFSVLLGMLLGFGCFTTADNIIDTVYRSKIAAQISSTTDFNKILDIYSEMSAILVSAHLVDGKIEIIRRYESKFVIATYPATKEPDTIIKEIYVAKDGKIVLEKNVVGTIIPAQAERVEFSE